MGILKKPAPLICSPSKKKKTTLATKNDPHFLQFLHRLLHLLLPQNNLNIKAVITVVFIQNKGIN